MATPRKHWFRVMDSIARDDFTNDELATLIRLMAALNTQWARDGLDGAEAASIVLRRHDACSVTNRASFARASRVLHAVAEKVSLVIEADRASVKITWPKWLESQNLASPTRGKTREKASRESPPPQDAPARRKTPPQDIGEELPSPEDRGEAPEVRTEVEPKGKRRRMGLCPEPLSPEDRERLEKWGSRNGYDPDELAYAATAVARWSRKKNQRYADWVAAIQDSLRKGWSLDGYEEARTRRLKAREAEAIRQFESDGEVPNA